MTIGADDNIFPTLTNEHSVTVTYSSSDDNVASIDENGDITLIIMGSATITASFAGDETYEADEASYLLTVNEAQPDPGPVDPVPVVTTYYADVYADDQAETAIESITFESDGVATETQEIDGTTYNLIPCTVTSGGATGATIYANEDDMQYIDTQTRVPAYYQNPQNDNAWEVYPYVMTISTTAPTP